MQPGERKSYGIITDFLWSLFIAAINSYRWDSVVRPFPSHYVTEDFREKDIHKLRSDAQKLSPVHIINKNLPLSNVPPESLELLDWFVSSQNFTLHLKDKNDFCEIKKLTGQVMEALEPDLILEVVPSTQSNAKFCALKKDFNVLYAYHGSRLENFYSILHNGLIGHMNKNSLFGSGTYLSSELSISLLYSPMGHGWDKSVLGPKLSCVAVCEVIDHPSVKCHTKDKDQAFRSHAPDSLGEIVPEKYYVVPNNDLLRVRYLLVYTTSNQNAVRKRTSWWKRNKLATLMMIYFAILLMIGLASSSFMHFTVKKIFS